MLVASSAVTKDHILLAADVRLALRRSITHPFVRKQELTVYTLNNELENLLTNVVNIDFNDLAEAIPCYICIIAMPFFYSISEGIAMGVISYVVLNLVTGKAKGRISVLMYVLAVLFVLKYLFL